MSSGFLPLSKSKIFTSETRGAMLAVGVASALINVLYLTGSFFMLEVYDRVLPSKSVPTLIALCILAVILYLFQGCFEWTRSRILCRISTEFDENITTRIFLASIAAPLKTKESGDGMHHIRDLDQVKSFLASGGPGSLFDLPWLPLYIFICFMFHPVIGLIVLFGAIVLGFITILNHYSTSQVAKLAVEVANQRNAFARSAIRNTEVLHSMGMAGRFGRSWEIKNAGFCQQNLKYLDVVSGYGAMTKMFRITLQSGVLAVGAYLVIMGQASAGIIIAGSILSARALAPVETAIANWKGFTAALQSWKRLKLVLNALDGTGDGLKLPPPRTDLLVEGLVGGAPATGKVLVADLSFSLQAGSALGVIGASASGKSSLARLLVGIWPIYRGSVRLDGAALDQWNGDDLGKHIGYLPQDVELFSGTISNNISRFLVDAAPDKIIAAARAAGVHDLILRLPNGYETEIGEGGASLSAGQRQRIGLARALFGEPFLVVLDEPNSNLDAEGEEALNVAILGIRQRGGVAIVIAHRPSALMNVDFVLVMSNGRAQAFGPKSQVLNQALVRKPDPVLERQAQRVAARVEEGAVQ